VTGGRALPTRYQLIRTPRDVRPRLLRGHLVDEAERRGSHFDPR
jgi:hypothetical protein